jgi:PAS domain-containing protein
MTKIDDWSTQRRGLREAAEVRLRNLNAPPSVGSFLGVDALALLYQLASTPERAGDALKLLHELQVHQVELDLLHAELEDSQCAMADDLARYKSLFDFAPVGSFVLDFDGRILEANLAGAQLLGLAREDAVGGAMEDHLTPGTRQLLGGLLAKCRGADADLSVEIAVAAGAAEAGATPMPMTGRLLPDKSSVLLVVTG